MRKLLIALGAAVVLTAGACPKKADPRFEFPPAPLPTNEKAPPLETLEAPK